MKLQLFVFLLFAANTLTNAQGIIQTDFLPAPAKEENIRVIPLYSDSLTSSFMIWINQEVSLHMHKSHTEQVYIVEGYGEMVLGDSTIEVKQGDFISIPKGTPHSLKVLSELPVKAISIQAPEFIGKDRVLLKE